MLTDKHVNYNTFPSSSTYSEDVNKRDGSRRKLEAVDCRNLVSFWFLGVCTDFGYWIILTGAHDLLSQGENDGTMQQKSTSGRECNQLSTGVILVVNIIPNFIMKMVLPFLPLWINTRTFIAIIFSISGFGLAASNQTQIYMLSGVGLCSLAVGIWTSSYLMYLPYFNDKRVVKAWCSGCGAAGFLASMIYVALTTVGISIKTILSFMMVVPVIMALVFWFLLEHPDDQNEKINYEPTIPYRTSRIIVERLKIVCRLIFLYTAPYVIVFFCQYLINQGLFELIQFKNSFIDLATQVRWFTFNYLLAVLIASSFIQLKVDCLWLMSLIQTINLCIMGTESIYGWMGDSAYAFWIVVTLIYWEGTIAGISYVNTYRRINDEIPVNHREFSMSFNSVGASFGMLFAGLCAVPLHNFICNLPIP